MRPAWLIAAMMSTLSACTTLPPSAQFKAVHYSVSGRDGKGMAARSIEADGRVEGSHLSGDMSRPMVAMSSETAKPGDIEELKVLSRNLPAKAAADGPGDAKRHPARLDIQFDDGTTRHFEGGDDGEFADPTLQRIVAIIRTYRAGYW